MLEAAGTNLKGTSIEFCTFPIITFLFLPVSVHIYVSGNPCLYTPLCDVLVKINMKMSLDKISTDTELLCKMWLRLTAIWQQGVDNLTYWLHHAIHWWTLRCRCYLRKCQGMHNFTKICKVLHTILCHHLTFTTLSFHRSDR